MKLTRFKILAALAFALAHGISARAQADGAPDFSAFKLITDRNIFDPNRYPRSTHNYRPRVRTNSRSVPTFGLVGTMDYQKGMFAFFDGNDLEYRKVLETNGVIAGYTITDITLAGVTLKSTGTNAGVLDLKIGSQLRLEGDSWELSGGSEAFQSGSSSANPVSSSSSDDNSSAPAPFSSSGAAPNDVLKRLMQQRAQETK